MATILLNIQASQFSTFLLAIHHIAVMAEADTSESSRGVLLSVKRSSTHQISIQKPAKKAMPVNSCGLLHQLIGYA